MSRYWWWIGSGAIGLNCLFIQSAMALSAVEVGRIAKSVTVSIDSNNSVGSGVVIKKDGNTYTVLTAAHVVRNRQQEFKITTPDGKNYPLIATNLQVLLIIRSLNWEKSRRRVKDLSSMWRGFR
jgi:hypothetical protein